jgi:hypothetical protein
VAAQAISVRNLTEPAIGKAAMILGSLAAKILTFSFERTSPCAEFIQCFGPTEQAVQCFDSQDSDYISRVFFRGDTRLTRIRIEHNVTGTGYPNISRAARPRTISGSD